MRSHSLPAVFNRRHAIVLLCMMALPALGASAPASPATHPTRDVGCGLTQGSTATLPNVADLKAPQVSGPVLFYGSSSIRLWNTLKEDFAGLNVVNHGFGGSTAPEANAHFDRLVVSCHPSIIVFYEGDNDLTEARTPDQILADYQTFARLVRDQLPGTRIIFLAIKPCPSRVTLLSLQRQTNTLVKDWIRQTKDPRLSFVDVFEPMLDAQGHPRAELFGPDHLHMNRDGYRLWVRLIGLVPEIEEETDAQMSRTNGSPAPILSPTRSNSRTSPPRARRRSSSTSPSSSSPSLDWRTFRVGDIGWGSTVIDVPAHGYFQRREDMTRTLGFFVDVSADINVFPWRKDWISSSRRCLPCRWQLNCQSNCKTRCGGEKACGGFAAFPIIECEESASHYSP